MEVKTMWLGCVVMTMLLLGAAHGKPSHAGNGAGASSVAGSFSGGAGSTGVHAGAYDTSGGGFGGGFAGVNSGSPFDFHSLFNDYFAQMAKFHADMANHVDTYAYTTGGWKNAKAESSLTYDNPQSLQSVQQNIVRQSQDLANRIAGEAQTQSQGQSQGYGQGYGYSGSYGTGQGQNQGAFASGSIGNGGTYQTAAVFPENPNNPNIINRFSEAGIDGAGDGQPKFYGVMSSSSSSSSNINGKQEKQHESETVINDNGKITRYHVKNP